jgi:hypothetical protein
MTKLNHRDIEVTKYESYTKYEFKIVGDVAIGKLNANGDVHSILSDEGNIVLENCDTIVVHTHAGVFHADEVSAISMLLNVYFDKPIIVKRYKRNYYDECVTAEQLKTKFLGDFNKEFCYMHIILDIGKQYNTNPKYCIFLDHHQNAKLPASNMLLMEYFFTDEFAKSIRGFMSRVSDIDKDKSSMNEHPTEYSNIIRSFNTDPKDDALTGTYLTSYTYGNVLNHISNQTCSFMNVVNYSNIVISRIIANGLLKKESLRLFNKLPIFNKFKVSTGPITIPNWQEIAIEQKLHGLLTKDTQSESYVVICADTTQFKLYPGFNESFIHNTGFIAKYPTFEHAMSSIVEKKGDI